MMGPVDVALLGPTAFGCSDTIIAARIAAARHTCLGLHQMNEGAVFSGLCETHRASKYLALHAVRGLQYYVLRSTTAALQHDRDVVLELVKENGLELEYAAAELRSDRKVVLAAVTSDGMALEYTCVDLRGDREVVLAAVAQDGRAIQFAALELRNDWDVALVGINASGKFCFVHLPIALQADQQFVLAAARVSGSILGGVLERTIRCDPEIVLAALDTYGLALEYFPELGADRDVVLRAVRENGRVLALEAIAPSFRKDREILLTAVQSTNPSGNSPLEILDCVFKADKEIVLAAVRRNGLALEFASPDLQGDPDVVRTAVRDRGMVLQHASPALRADPETVLAASKDWHMWKHVEPALCADREFMLRALAKDGSALEYAAVELRADRELVLAAVREDEYALQFAAADLQRDRQLRNTSRMTMERAVFAERRLAAGRARAAQRQIDAVIATRAHVKLADCWD